MAAFVLAFRGAPDRVAPEGEDQRWMAWFEEIGPSIADFGNRIGTTRMVEADRPAAAGDAVLTGYLLINADDLGAAVRVASGCPGLRSGVSVEVGQTLAM
jgi:hypothetical protein